MLKALNPIARLLVFALLASAALPQLGRAQSPISLQLTPPNARLRAAPGDTLSGTLELTNSADGAVTLSVLRSDFVLTPDGHIRPIEPASLPASLADWLSLAQTSLVLPAHASTQVRYSLTVPGTVAPGTHWGAVMFRTEFGAGGASDDTSNSLHVRYSAQLAFPIMVDVGDLAYAGSVTDITLQASTAGSPRTLVVAYQNTGNALSKLTGRVELRSLSGTLVDTIPVTSTAVLPGQMRLVSVPVGSDIKAGTYLATAILDNGASELVAGQAQVRVAATP